MESVRINLVPLATRRSFEMRRIAIGWATILLVLLVACLLLSSIARGRLRQQQASVELLTSTTQPVEQLMQEVAVLATQQQRLDELEVTLAQLVPSDDLLQTLGVIAKSVDSGNESAPKIRRAHISIQNASVPTDLATDIGRLGNGTHVRLTISASDDQQIQTCLDALRLNPRFREVRILNSVQDSSTAQRQVEIDAFVFVSKEVPK